jgi:hypothetical protein
MSASDSPEPPAAQPAPGTKPPASKTVQVCALIFVALGIGIFQAVAPSLFPPPPVGGFNFTRFFWAAVVGAVCGGVGAGVGKLIERMRG